MTRYGAILATLTPMQFQGFFRAGFCYSLSAGRMAGLNEVRRWAGTSGNCFAQLSDLGAIKAWPTQWFPPFTRGIARTFKGRLHSVSSRPFVKDEAHSSAYLRPKIGLEG